MNLAQLTAARRLLSQERIHGPVRATLEREVAAEDDAFAASAAAIKRG